MDLEGGTILIIGGTAPVSCMRHFMKNRVIIIILAGLSMLGAFSTDTYLPSFPSIAAEFQIGLDVSSRL